MKILCVGGAAQTAAVCSAASCCDGTVRRIDRTVASHFTDAGHLRRAVRLAVQGTGPVALLHLSAEGAIAGALHRFSQRGLDPEQWRDTVRQTVESNLVAAAKEVAALSGRLQPRVVCAGESLNWKLRLAGLAPCA